MTIEAGASTAPTTRSPAAELVTAIYRTIRYAALFDQAITAHDIARYLDISAAQSEILQTLETHNGRDWLLTDGYYHLLGQAHLVERTREHARRAQFAWPRACRWATLIAHLPFVRMIAVTGSLAMNNMGADADIDYLVVTAPGRVWTTRLFLVTLVRIARLGGDELCPNYVLSTTALQLTDQSLTTARELMQMVPVYGEDCYEEMLRVNNWASQYLPAANGPPQRQPLSRLSGPAQLFKASWEAILRTPLGNWLEAWEMRRKIARLSQLPGAEPPHVILTAEQCKGHFRTSHHPQI